MFQQHTLRDTALGCIAQARYCFRFLARPQKKKRRTDSLLPSWSLHLFSARTGQNAEAKWFVKGLITAWFWSKEFPFISRVLKLDFWGRAGGEEEFYSFFMFSDLSSNLLRGVLWTLSLTILSHPFEIWDTKLTIKSCWGCGPSFHGAASYLTAWECRDSSIDIGSHPSQSSSRWGSRQKARQKLWVRLQGVGANWDSPWRPQRGTGEQGRPMCTDIRISLSAQEESARRVILWRSELSSSVWTRHGIVPLSEQKTEVAGGMLLMYLNKWEWIT